MAVVVVIVMADDRHSESPYGMAAPSAMADDVGIINQGNRI